MRMEDGHCSALYDRRPHVCRQLARGSVACQAELRTKAARVAAEYGK